jgi:hypothetical protein
VTGRPSVTSSSAASSPPRASGVRITRLRRA